MDLTACFIPAPLSALYTLLLGISMALVFDEVGLRFFRKRELWCRALYYFSGLAIVSYVIMLLSIASLISAALLQTMAAVFIIAGLSVALRRRHSIVLSNPLSLPDGTGNKLLQYAIAFTLLCYCILSLAPPTDADSLDYHLGVPLEILGKGSLNLNPDNLHFRLFGFGEMLNMLGIANGCVQLGSFLQMLAFGWLLFVYVNAVPDLHRLSLLTLMLGIPLLLFFIPGQKHQLTGIAGSALCFYVLSRHSEEVKGPALWLTCLVLSFIAEVKYSFLISSLVLATFALIKLPRKLKTFTVLAIAALILLAPLYYFKFSYYHDPLSPLLERFRDQPDITVAHFADGLKHFRDSTFPFPVNLFIPSSLGYVTTIIGIGAASLIVSAIFSMQYKAETITICLFVILTACLGQMTARFFIEPVFWTLPLLFFNADKTKWLKYLFKAARLQFILLLPFTAFAAYTLGIGIVSNSAREKVMRYNASGYAESRWMDSIVPAHVLIATDIRSRALLPRPYFPFEYIYVSDTSILNKMMTKYQPEYLVLKEDCPILFRERYSGEMVASRTFYKATRNPLNSKSFVLTIYRKKER